MSEGDVGPTDDVTAAVRSTGLSDHIVRALMAADLKLPNRHTVDTIGFTFAQRRAIDDYRRQRRREGD